MYHGPLINSDSGANFTYLIKKFHQKPSQMKFGNNIFIPTEFIGLQIKREIENFRL